jgi:hypothetical protein
VGTVGCKHVYGSGVPRTATPRQEHFVLCRPPKSGSRIDQQGYGCPRSGKASRVKLHSSESTLRTQVSVQVNNDIRAAGHESQNGIVGALGTLAAFA